MCCMRLAGNTGRKNDTKNRHLQTITQLWLYLHNEGVYRQLETKLLISSTRLHNMANFDSLAAEIGSVVWGTPENFNRFLILASLLQLLPRHRSPETNQTLHDVWPSPGLVHYYHTL